MWTRSGSEVKCRTDNNGWTQQWRNLKWIIQWSSNFLLIIHNHHLIHHLLISPALFKQSCCLHHIWVQTEPVWVYWISAVRVKQPESLVSDSWTPATSQHHEDLPADSRAVVCFLRYFVPERQSWRGELDEWQVSRRG